LHIYEKLTQTGITAGSGFA